MRGRQTCLQVQTVDRDILGLLNVVVWKTDVYFCGINSVRGLALITLVAAIKFPFKAAVDLKQRQGRDWNRLTCLSSSAAGRTLNKGYGN